MQENQSHGYLSDTLQAPAAMLHFQTPNSKPGILAADHTRLRVGVGGGGGGWGALLRRLLRGLLNTAAVYEGHDGPNFIAHCKQARLQLQDMGFHVHKGAAEEDFEACRGVTYLGVDIVLYKVKHICLISQELGLMGEGGLGTCVMLGRSWR